MGLGSFFGGGGTKTWANPYAQWMNIGGYGPYWDFLKDVEGVREAAKPRLGAVSRRAMEQEFSDLMGGAVANLAGRKRLGGSLETGVTRRIGEDVIRRLGPTYKQMELAGATAAAQAGAMPLDRWLQTKQMTMGGYQPVSQGAGPGIGMVGDLVGAGIGLYLGQQYIDALKGLGGGKDYSQLWRVT